jgi:hypothetical protein
MRVTIQKSYRCEVCGARWESEAAAVAHLTEYPDHAILDRLTATEATSPCR